jgi:hypothetical protein
MSKSNRFSSASRKGKPVPVAKHSHNKKKPSKKQEFAFPRREENKIEDPYDMTEALNQDRYCCVGSVCADG